ncbi:hypothetical protein C1T17_08885 [Sphingobium sp. SCG-1]|nr:hypothetical protein C1T17_08885 [Sphingobium sp. SCG-1]
MKGIFDFNIRAVVDLVYFLNGRLYTSLATSSCDVGAIKALINGASDIVPFFGSNHVMVTNGGKNLINNNLSGMPAVDAN